MEILMKWKLGLTSSCGVSLVEASTQEFITGVKKWQDQILFFKKRGNVNHIYENTYSTPITKIPCTRKNSNN